MSEYTLEKKEHIDKIFSKLVKRNPKVMKIIYKKLEQILEENRF